MVLLDDVVEVPATANLDRPPVGILPAHAQFDDCGLESATSIYRSRATALVIAAFSEKAEF